MRLLAVPMIEISHDEGVARALDALYAGRLALLCGAGLSMAPPSSLPSAAALAFKAKQKYDATFGAERAPLPDTIDEQAEFFFRRNELGTVYLRTYVDRNDFSAPPNGGHLAVADLLLTRCITIAVSTNVDTLIESAGNQLFGNIAKGTSPHDLATVPQTLSPLLKIHGCWTQPLNTIWAPSQFNTEPTRSRIENCSHWLQFRLLDKDLIIVGFWTDWSYLNEILDTAIGAVTPSRVIVVDPCETATLKSKAPALYALGRRATIEFCHLRESGDRYLDGVRAGFSRTYIRRVLHAGQASYSLAVGEDADPHWLEPAETDSA
jgi:SIR2-like domain